MKNYYIFIAFFFSIAALEAQTFTDDFEAYALNSYVGQVSTEWTTWSGGSSTSEDAMVVNTNSFSGSQSIYFTSSSTSGGPQDVVLPFGATYETGKFQYEMKLFLANGSDAYFNFQGDQVIGTTWAADCHIRNDGQLTLSNTNGTLLNTVVPIGSWFRFGINVNLNENQWEVFIDSNSVGTFTNSINKIASIDIFPMVIAGSGGSLSSFWVDDVYYNYTTLAVPNLDLAVNDILGMSGVVGYSKTPSVKVRNTGSTTITSFDVSINWGTNTSTESITGVSLATFDEFVVPFQDEILLETALSISSEISNVNGMASDDDSSNDLKVVQLDPIIPAPNKQVFVEEATGTWCQYCPRGAVWMERMQQSYYNHFVGVAVHNGDPMTNEIYDAGYGNYISGYPSSTVDRGADVDPSGMEPDFLQRIQMEPTGLLCESAKHYTSLDSLKIQLQVILQGSVNPAWKVAFVLSEDSVTGTGSGYNQANAYSGGGLGDLSGAGLDWHNQPFSVPASIMVYNHVGRVIAPSVNGDPQSFPNGGVAGDTFNFSTMVYLDPSWDLNQIHVIGVLFDQNGRADNAISYHLQDALENAECNSIITTVKEIKSDAVSAVSLFPNPAQDFLRVRLATDGANSHIRIVNMIGTEVMSINTGTYSGIHELNIDLSEFASGIYLLEFHDGKGKTEIVKFLKD